MSQIHSTLSINLGGGGGKPLLKALRGKVLHSFHSSSLLINSPARGLPLRRFCFRIFVLATFFCLALLTLMPIKAHALSGADVAPGAACSTEDAMMMSANPSGTGGYILTCESGEWAAAITVDTPTANNQATSKEYVDAAVAAAGGGGFGGRFIPSCTSYGSGSSVVCIVMDSETGQSACRTSGGVTSSGNPWTDCAAGLSLGISSMQGSSINIVEGGGAGVYAANGFGWGYGSNGHVGNGGTSQANVPAALNLNLTFTKIVGAGESGQAGSCGIASGKLYCWGHFYGGQNEGGGLSGTYSSPAAVDLSAQNYPTVVDVEVGVQKTAFRITDGTWWSWGHTGGTNDYYYFGGTSSSIGQAQWYPTGTITLANLPNDFTKVALGTHHMCGLRSNGKVHCAVVGGDNANYRGVLGRPGSVYNAYCNGAGTARIGNHTDRLTEDCPVLGGHTFTDLAITGGGAYLTACAVANDGNIYCWGTQNGYGQLGKGSTADGDGTAVAVDKSVSGPVTFAKVYGAVNASSQGFYCALDSTGKAYCWGHNGYGQLGTGDTSNRTRPTPVLGNYTFDQLALGWRHSCGLTTGGLMYCWGFGNVGQLGYGGTSDKLIPEPVSGGVDFVGIAAGYYNSYGWK